MTSEDLDLVRIWTQWLGREYDAINAYYRLNLRRPTLKVAESERRLGYWDPTSQAITISASAIRRYPWHEVIQVLKHEMAHQLVAESGFFAERPHGREFQAACRRLGLPEWAARASGDLPHEIPDWRESNLSADEQRLLTKVHKLLALAGSDNEHEASLAVQRIREMYAKYNLEQMRQHQESGMVTWVHSFRKQRVEAWQTFAFTLLDRYFFVRVIHLKQFDAQDCRSYAAAEVMGKKQNVLMAEYVFRFLSSTLDSLWEKRRKSWGKKFAGPLRAERRNYIFGVLKGFELQLEQTREQSLRPPGISENECRALVVAIDRELDNFFRTKYPRTTRSRGASVDSGSAGYKHGKEDGAKIKLHRPLEGAEKNGPLRRLGRGSR